VEDEFAPGSGLSATSDSRSLCAKWYESMTFQIRWSLIVIPCVNPEDTSWGCALSSIE